jgi:hypothetical protein
MMPLLVGPWQGMKPACTAKAGAFGARAFVGRATSNTFGAFA